ALCAALTASGTVRAISEADRGIPRVYGRSRPRACDDVVAHANGAAGVRLVSAVARDDDWAAAAWARDRYRPSSRRASAAADAARMLGIKCATCRVGCRRAAALAPEVRRGQWRRRWVEIT